MASSGPTEECWRSGCALGRTLMAGIFALVLAMGIGRFAYTPILPAMQERFDLSNAAASTLASSNYLGYLFGAILAAFVPAGRLQDTLLRVSLVLAAVSTVLVGLTTDFATWLALRFLAGLSSAGVFMFASAVVLGQLARRGRSGLSGRFYVGVGLGIALSGLIVLSLNGLLAGDPVAWRADWLCLGALSAALVGPCWAWLPNSEIAGKTGSGVSESADGVSESSGGVPAGTVLAMVLLCVAYFLEGGGYIVTGTFLPKIVEDLPGLGGLRTGSWVVVGLAAAPSTVLWARTAQRVGYVRALLLCYLIQAVGIALPALSGAAWAAAASAVLFGGTFVSIAALTLTYARRLVGMRAAGLMIGILTAAYGVGQVLGPLVAAALAEGPNGFRLALFAAASTVALGGLLMPVVELLWQAGKRYEENHAHDGNHSGLNSRYLTGCARRGRSTVTASRKEDLHDTKDQGHRDFGDRTPGRAGADGRRADYPRTRRRGLERRRTGLFGGRLLGAR